MVWSHSPVWLLVAEISAAWVPECTGEVTTVSPAWHTHGLRLPVSNPPLTSELGGGAVEPIVQVKLAEPFAPVESVAVTVTFDVPAAVGVPEIRPDELIDRPAGSPVAEKASVCPEAESVPLTLRLAAVPTVPVWLPGLLTVTVLPGGVAELANVSWWMFQPPLSWSMVRVCWPAGRVTFAVTVVQVCQPPVAGTLMFPDRLAPDELAMCRPSVTALGAASRKLTV